MIWGYHLRLNVSGCNDKILKKEELDKWICELVEKIDMITFGAPQIVHFGKNEPHLSGWTVTQLIETSNIMAHFCDNTKQAYIDIFSCREFHHDLAINHFKEFFEPANIWSDFTIRSA